MSRFLRITNGCVYDPVNHVDGEVKDIFVEGECICVSLPSGSSPGDIQCLDATGCVVMPGGIDLHTHLTTPRTQDHPLLLTAQQAANRYTAMGYTTVIDAAVGLHDVSQVRAELSEAANLDTGFLLELGNHEPMIDLLDRGDEQAALDMIADLLRSTGAYGIKLVNPGSNLHFHRDPNHQEPESIDQGIAGTRRVTPRHIMLLAADAARKLQLPHATHLHCGHLGEPGNIRSTIHALSAFGDQPVHLAHAQFYAYGSTPQGDYTSAAPQLCDYLSRHPRVTIDTGQVVFGPACFLTLDDALRHRLRGDPGSTPHSPGDAIMPFKYQLDHPVHSLQWATGLELILCCDNLRQISLTVDHPNGGPFWAYPQIIAWLMSKTLRDEMLAHAHPHATQHSTLKTIDRELTLQEIATITRAAPAGALGLQDHGHLGPNARADLVIYPDDPAHPQQMFEQPRAVIKSGGVVFQDGRLQRPLPNRTLHPSGMNDTDSYRL